MKIEELMSGDPEVCTPKDSCAAALDIMKRRNCGFVPMVESQESMRLVGVVTDRDIALYLLEADCPPGKGVLQDCMTPNPKAISPEASLDEAARLMETAAVHRLPVVQGSKLIGILALKDIATFAAHAHGTRLSSELEPAERKIAEVIEAIAVAR